MGRVAQNKNTWKKIEEANKWQNNLYHEDTSYVPFLPLLQISFYYVLVHFGQPYQYPL